MTFTTAMFWHVISDWLRFFPDVTSHEEVSHNDRGATDELKVVVNGRRLIFSST